MDVAKCPEMKILKDSKTFVSTLAILMCVVFAISSDEAPKMVFTKPLYVENENYVYFQVVEPPTLRYIFTARPAKNFGVQFNQTYSSVELFIGEPNLGCSTLINAPMIRGNSVLLVRGQCSFLTKALNAEEAGAVFVIIADDDSGSTNARIEMVHDETGRKCNIPALFIPGKDGYMIMEKMAEQNIGTYALLNIPVNLTAIPYHKRNHPPWTLI